MNFCVWAVITPASQRKRPSWNSGLDFFFVRSQIAVKSKSRMRNLWLWRMGDVWLMSTWHGVMADEKKLSRCKISTDTVYNTLKTHTKYAHIIRGRPTLRDVERFRNGSVREPYERSLYERTFMSEPFIEKHAILTELSNVNREKHRRKTYRACRRDCEPSRILVRSLKGLRNKSRKDKPIIALKKKLRQMQAEKTKFIYKESPGERTYTSSFYYVLRKKGGNRKRLWLFSFILGKTYGSVVIFILNYVMKPFQSCFITNSVSWHLVNIQWFLPSTQNLPLN